MKDLFLVFSSGIDFFLTNWITRSIITFNEQRRSFFRGMTAGKERLFCFFYKIGNNCRQSSSGKTSGGKDEFI